MGSCLPNKTSNNVSFNKKQIKIPSHSTDNIINGNHTPPELIQPLLDQNITEHSASFSASFSASLGSDIITTNNDQISHHSDQSDIDTEIINDKMTLLTTKQSNKLLSDGYCMIDDPLREIQIRYAVEGYIRKNYTHHRIIKELIRQIIHYYGSRFNTQIYIELNFCNRLNPSYFLVPRRNIKLSGVLSNIKTDINKVNMDEITKKRIDINTLHNALTYLGHHKGIEPDPLPCPVRSIHMQQIVSDKWDAVYMDGFEKKQIFEIILTAQHLGIKSLLHLGCAKIATLIKQLDQKEINRIIEEEEKYRREHAQNDENETDNKENVSDKNDDIIGNNDNNGNDEMVVQNDDNMENNQVVIQRKYTDLIDKNSNEYEENGVMDEENE